MIAQVAERLAANAEVFRHLVGGVSREQTRWKPSPDKWSLLEVLNHLADEEQDDFRKRVDLTLHHPGEPWPPIDPVRWAVERRYNERALAESLDRFMEERGRSVEWLRGIGEVDLEAAREHPEYGSLSAGDLLTSWLAHDLIHVRQMTRLHYEYLFRPERPYSPAYAGSW